MVHVTNGAGPERSVGESGLRDPVRDSPAGVSVSLKAQSKASEHRSMVLRRARS